VGTVVENKQVVEMPLNGRNFTQLTVLVPGSIPTGGATFQTSNGTRVAISGATPDDNNYTLDGVNNNETFFKAYAIQPSIEALQEFKIQTNITNAEYGNAAGANISLVTKSGSNDFHATVFEFLRNDVLDARDPNATTRPKFRQNQYGAVVTGPVIKNRTFFMFNYEAYRFRRGATALATVPTAAQLAGDLSHDWQGRVAPQIFDPLTTRPDPNDATKLIRDPFVGNIIPSNRLDPITKKHADVMYAPYPPNLPGQPSNLINTEASSNDADQYNFRIDHKFTEKNNFFVRMSWSDSNQTAPQGIPGIPSYTTNSFRNFMGSDTHMFNSTTILETRFAYHFNNLFNTIECPGGYDAVKQFIDSTGLQGVPYSKNPDFPTWPRMNFSDYSEANQDGYPFQDATYQFVANLSKNKGKHFIKVGMDYQHRNNYDDGLFSAIYTFTKEPTQDPQNLGSTGQGIAAYLLGFPTTGQRNIGNTRAAMFWNGYYPYIQDDIKVNSKLTINLGLRYDYTQWPRAIDGQMGSFDIYTGDWVWTDTNPITGEPANRENGLINPDRNNFAPRAGAAYMLNNKTTLRGGYGMFYNTDFIWEAQGTRGNWPFAIAETLTQLNYTYPTSPIKTTFNTYLEVQPNTPVPPGAQHIHDRQRKVGYTHQWNFTLQRELVQGMVLEVGYVATKSGKRSLFANTNTAPPGPGDPNPRRKYPELGTTSIMTDTGRGEYHGLQTKLEKRFSKGLSFTANYTYSKNLNLAGTGFSGSESPQNPDRPEDDWGLSGLHRRHLFSSNWIYELPFGRGRTYGNNMSKVADAFLGGWQVSGIVTMYSGQALTVTVPRDTANIGARGVNQRANNTGQSPDIDNQTRAAWFNTSVFFVPPLYTFGNSGRGVVIGPGSQNWTLGVYKNFIIAERHRVQFRAEAYNAFNHPNWPNPNTNVESANFGKITSVSGSRSLQFGLKYSF
jgi:hypothetical protein